MMTADAEEGFNYFTIFYVDSGERIQYVLLLGRW